MSEKRATARPRRILLVDGSRLAATGRPYFPVNFSGVKLMP